MNGPIISKYSQLSESVRILELWLLMKYADVSNQNSADFAYTHLISNFKILRLSQANKASKATYDVRIIQIL